MDDERDSLDDSSPNDDWLGLSSEGVDETDASLDSLAEGVLLLLLLLLLLIVVVDVLVAAAVEPTKGVLSLDISITGMIGSSIFSSNKNDDNNPVQSGSPVLISSYSKFDSSSSSLCLLSTLLLSVPVVDCSSLASLLSSDTECSFALSSSVEGERELTPLTGTCRCVLPLLPSADAVESAAGDMPRGELRE